MTVEYLCTQRVQVQHTCLFCVKQISKHRKTDLPGDHVMRRMHIMIPIEQNFPACHVQLVTEGKSTCSSKRKHRLKNSSQVLLTVAGLQNSARSSSRIPDLAGLW